GMMSSAQRNEVVGVIEGWADAVRRKDLAGVMAHHDPAVVFFDVPEPVQLRGLDAYRDAWREFLDWVTGFELQELEVATSGDVAYCHAIVRCSGRTQSEPFDVRLSMGLRRFDAEWVITHEHHSVPAVS